MKTIRTIAALVRTAALVPACGASSNAIAHPDTEANNNANNEANNEANKKQ